MKRAAAALTLGLMLLTAWVLLPSNPAAAAAENPQLEWSRTFGRNSTATSHRDAGNTVIQTSDGGYAIAARLWDYHYGSGGGDHWYGGILVKTDSMGRTQWKSIGWESTPSLSNSIIQTKNSGYLISYDSPLQVSKLDDKGAGQWSKDFGLSILRMVQVDDGSYILAGTTTFYSGYDSGENITIINIDRDGNILWKNTLNAYAQLPEPLPDYPRAMHPTAFDIKENPKGGYIATGTWSDEGFWAFSVNLWLIKLDSNGNLQLNRTYNLFNNPTGSPLSESAQLFGAKIHVTKDGGFILSGGLARRNYYSPWLAKIGENGVLEWSREYADGTQDTSNFESAVQTKDGGYFAVGIMGNNPYHNQPTYPLLIKTDQFGNVQWNITGYAGHWDTGSAYSCIVTNDGAYVVTGSVNDDAWLAKFSPDSYASPDDSSPNNAFPVPVAAAVAAIVAVGAVAGLFFLRRRKRQVTVVEDE